MPFTNLNIQYESIKEEIHDALCEVLESKKFVQNKFCRQFARNFLAVHGGSFGTGCSNGTSALKLALQALGIGYGDEVITSNSTFFATVEAIVEVGARPILVDCRPDTYGIDCLAVEKAIGKKTKAVIPVHLYGNPCDMDKLCEIANEYKIDIIEDCAQAHLAHYKDQPVGTFGKAGAFSFYPGKNLGAYGDAGFVMTESESLHDLVSMHLNHGRKTKYEHQFMAGNYRMDDMQAAILNVKCKYISHWTEQRISLARRYDGILKAKGYKVIEVESGSKCVYHLYIVEVGNRDDVIENFKNLGIEFGIHYPIPMSLQPACSSLGYKKGDFPVSEDIASKIISLPLYPEMSEQVVDTVAGAL